MTNHDYLSDRAANFKLMSDIKTWWRRRGYIVHVWLEKVRDPSGSEWMHVIRTNIVQNVAAARMARMVE